jgi:tetrahedral aminopeptidase
MTLDIKATLKKLTETTGIAGTEDAIRELAVEIAAPLADEVRVDTLGNVVAFKRGSDPAPGRLMLAAHMDEIGLMVTKLDRGFIRFTGVGGVDPRVLVSQEVVVQGRQALPGLIASRPPHVLPPADRKKSIPMDQLFVDVGLSAAELEQVVAVGDLITIQREMWELGEDFVAGKAMDNRASLVAVLAVLDQLQGIRHRWDVYVVATVQEEVGLRGAITSTFGINPDVGIALDVTFAEQAGVSSEKSVAWKKGPAIGLGPNIHPKLHAMLVETATAHEVPFTVEVLPGNSGTDAWAMQVTQAGVATGLLSIPIRNMHTSVETLAVQDIQRTVRLLSAWIGGLDEDSLSSLALD